MSFLNVFSTFSRNILVVIISVDKNQTKFVRYSDSKRNKGFSTMAKENLSIYLLTLDISVNLNYCVSDRDAGAVVVVNEAR